MFIITDKINDVLLDISREIEYIDNVNVIFLDSGITYYLLERNLFEGVEVPQDVTPFNYKFDGENFIPMN